MFYHGWLRVRMLGSGAWLRSIIPVLIMPVLVVPIPDPVAGQENPCDEEILTRARSGRMGYQQREATRCEGFYGAKVSGIVIRVVGLTETFEYDPSAQTPLRLEWQAPQNPRVHLTAQSLKYEVYYQMDAQADSPNVFVWDTRMLNSQDLSADEIGLLGFFTRGEGPERQRILVPVKADHASRVGSGPFYQLTLLPNSQLSEISYTVTAADDTGKPTGAAVLDNVRIRRRRFSEGEPVIITIDKNDLPARGTFVLELSATRSNGRPVRTAPVLFYHPGS